MELELYSTMPLELELGVGAGEVGYGAGIGDGSGAWVTSGESLSGGWVAASAGRTMAGTRKPERAPTTGSTPERHPASS
jgi:hypothetical protein